MENIYMSRGASKVVNTCAKVKAGEQVLIVTELSRLSIAQALAAEVYRVGAEPAVCIMEPRKRSPTQMRSRRRVRQAPAAWSSPTLPRK